MRPFLALFVVLSAGLAGCINQQGTPAVAPQEPTTIDSPPPSIEAEYAAAALYATAGPDVKYGSLKGTVFNEERQPVEGAVVRIVAMAREVKTGEDGSFRFDRLGASTWTGEIRQPFYESKTVRFEIVADQEALAEIVLEQLPALRSYITILHRQGHYDCAMELPIAPGDCAATWAAKKEDSVTKENFTFPFEVTYPWQQLLIELTWDDAANNQLDGMRIKLSPGNESNDPFGHKTRIAIADGNTEPLRLLINASEVHPTAENYTGTHTPAFVPDQGGALQALVYPRGKFADEAGEICDPEGRCLLGVGAGADVKFDVYISTFYNQPMPAGFTAVGIS